MLIDRLFQHSGALPDTGAAAHAEGEGEICILPAIMPWTGSADAAALQAAQTEAALNGWNWRYLQVGGAGMFAEPAAPSQPQAITFDPSVNLADVPTDGVGVAYGDTFKLHSNPTSGLKIYLDFDGHTTTGTSWNSYWGKSSFYSPAFSLDGSESFTAAELAIIQQVWQRVAEMYAPFNVDVTTENPGTAGLAYSGTGDKSYGIRVVITDENGKNYGGIAYVGSFDWNSDTPTYVYANRLADNAKYMSDAAGHEIGHTLGLSHDGQGTSDYYYGHGSGATDWAPIMGAGYYANIEQFSKGEYYGATQLQDDFAIITTQNTDVTYRTDDYGNTFATAAALTGSLSGGVTSVSTYGIISGSGAKNDVDMFSLQVAAGGSINLTVSAWSQAWVSGSGTPLYDQPPFTSMDVQVTVYDSSLNPILVVNDPAKLDAVVKLSGLAGGIYYIAIDGVGYGDPMSSTPTGYTEYGSVGQYMIKGGYTGGTVPLSSLAVVGGTALSTTEKGGADNFVIAAQGATSDVLVSISGLDTTEGSLSANTVLLTAANNYTATVTVTGINDTAKDGAQAYALQLSAQGYASTSVSVTNADNDLTPATIGSAVGSYKKAPTVGNGSLAALAADDGSAMTINEGMSGGAYRLVWQWSFTGLTAGDQLLHLDAASASEGFRFEYSSNGGTIWAPLGGRTGASTLWQGDFAIANVGTSLLLRVTDGITSADNRRDSLAIDLMTVEYDHPSASAPLFSATPQLGAGGDLWHLFG